MAGPLASPPVTTNFRDLSDTLSPTYLLGPFGKRYRFSMAVMFDAVADGAAFAVLARYPSRAPDDAFGWLAADRLILQGFAESKTSYIGRLQQWLDLWGFAGTPTGMLLAMLGWVAPVQPKVLTVDNSGQWWTYAASTTPLGPPPASMPTPPTQTAPSPNWQWDSLGPDFGYGWLWARMWVVIFSIGSPWAAPTATWGGGTRWGDGTCWGWAGTHAQAAGMTTLARRWKSGEVSLPWVIVSYDATMFDSTQSFGSAKLPDGHWGRYGKVVADATYGTVYKPSRPPASTCSFIDGAP